MIIPVHYQIFGPVHPGYSQAYGPKYLFPETANTSSLIPPLPFSQKMPKVTWARWGVVWWPANDKSSSAQLVQLAADNSTPLQGVCKIFEKNPTGGPRPSGVIITEQFNRWIDAKQDLYIGIQLCDDGKQPTILYRSTIEAWYDTESIERNHG